MKALRLGLILAIATLVLAACGDGGSNLKAVSQPHNVDVKPEKPTVMTSNNPQLGPILTDYEGRTLYTYTGDTPSSGRSAAKGQLIIDWPMFSLIADKIVYSSEVGGTLDIITPDIEVDYNYTTKASQVTYNGQPLYYYIADAPGETKGQGVDGFTVAKP